MQKAIFIDKDGTLIPNIAYNVNPDKIHLMAGVQAALRQLVKQGYKIVIISNQPGIAHGYFTTTDITRVEQKIGALLREEGLMLSGFYYCPHLPADQCQCRKPRPGLIKKAARDLQIDLQGSWMIGDIMDDIEAGNRAGCQSILLDNGNETIWKFDRNRQPETICNSWEEIAAYIQRRTEIPEELLKLPTATHRLVSSWS